MRSTMSLRSLPSEAQSRATASMTSGSGLIDLGPRAPLVRSLKVTAACDGPSTTRDSDCRPSPANRHSPNSVSIFDIKSTGHFNVYS